MRVRVYGGTGFVGRALVPRLQQQGHEVTVVTRRREAVPDIEAAGARARVEDLLEAAGPAEAHDPVDALVLLAAPRLFGKRLGTRRFRRLKSEITRMYARALEVARAAGCPIVITGGTSFLTPGGAVADESQPLARLGAARIGEDVDPLVARAVAEGSPKIVWMLPGQIYGPGGLFLTLYDWLKRGRYYLLGDGRNRVPHIHVEDCAAAYAAAVARLDRLPTGSRFIAADDVPCTQREFMDHLADLLGVPHPKQAPTFVVKLMIGRLLFETATLDCRVSNAKAKRELDWAPRYPGYREGLAATVAALEKRTAS